ncbi:reverse transcriptase domain-containing protein [Tanacetum coccineum]|uniref:Reverse transcriptase domain-containing protein n=1 Tax=Tanacetum coccineum TaxID=301880 RepID=A0ABQ5BUQ7_9ASTR
MFTDESSCADGSGARLILTNPEGMEFTNALRFRFDATNNEAEYEALIARLKIAEQMGIDRGPLPGTEVSLRRRIHGPGDLAASRRHMIRRGQKAGGIGTLTNLTLITSPLPFSSGVLSSPDLSEHDPEGQILDSSYRLLHKVDRSQAGCNHYWKPDQKIRVG